MTVHAVGCTHDLPLPLSGGRGRCARSTRCHHARAGAEYCPPTRRQARRGNRCPRNDGRCSALRSVPRVQRRFRCQRRVSAARRPIGLLSCRSAGRFCFRSPSQRHHDANRQGAVTRGHCRRHRLLCRRRRAVSAAQSRRRRARQARRGTCQGRQRRAADPELRQLPRTRRRGRAAGDPVPCRTIRPLRRFHLADVAARFPEEQSRCDGGHPKKLDEQEIAAVAAYYQQVQSTLETVESQAKD